MSRQISKEVWSNSDPATQAAIDAVWEKLKDDQRPIGLSLLIMDYVPVAVEAVKASLRKRAPSKASQELPHGTIRGHAAYGCCCTPCLNAYGIGND